MSDKSRELATTPLYETHRSLGARMREFGGFDMPVQYTSIMEEHMAVRNAAGLFDVSHMGEFLVTGPTAETLVQRMGTNDASRLDPGQAMYTVMCNQGGGIVDDLLVYKLGAERFLLVVNAANILSDLEWVERHNEMDAEIRDLSDDMALLALQGPKSIDIAEGATGLSLQDLRYYRFKAPVPNEFYGCQHAVISATGYTGERGLEIYCDANRVETIWTDLMEEGEAYGLKPAGLGARDTLRIEAGYSLYGQDITETTNPFEAGLGWLVKLDKGPFVGREALRKIKAAGPDRMMIGFVMNDRGIPRFNYPILDSDGNEIGTVTSGTQSPVLDRGVGLGYVPNDAAFTTEGTPIQIEIRSRAVGATVKKPPLHKNGA